jgi:heme/copper-type cytochrome/quinol oxidase subunit 2
MCAYFDSVICKLLIFGGTERRREFDLIIIIIIVIIVIIVWLLLFLYLRCAVSVIGLVAVDSAHK